jgi:hypothetical protein
MRASAEAVSAAISMQRRVFKLNCEFKASGLPEIDLAARFEKLAQARQILIGQSTFEAVGERFSIRSYTETRVKGKNEPVPVYEVLWEKMES